MLRLNIPLSINPGTRLSISSRRVLWLVASWLVVILASFIAANLWFTRNTLSGYAPEETLAVIHLSPSRQTWMNLINNFPNIPLISSRSITVRDLSALPIKELAVFILPNNESALAIRISDKEMPTNLLKSLGIIAQKTNKNQWVLSSNLMPLNTKKQTQVFFDSIWPKTVGHLVINGFSGKIKEKNSGYEIEIPKIKERGINLPPLPNNSIAALAIQSGQNWDLTRFFGQINIFLEPWKTFGGVEIENWLKKEGGIIIIGKNTENKEKNNFLIEINSKQQVLAQVLQIAAAFQSPILETVILPDGAIIQEILVNPSLAQINPIWINGQEIMSATGLAGELYAFDGEKTDVLANNSQFLTEYLTKKQEKKMSTCGNNNLVFLKPKKIYESFNDDAVFISRSTLLEFTLKFATISLNKDKIYLCY